ncbi:MAG: hypothetical protein HGA61_00655 [Candidatus Moranbacteria bacterium]|nr:hypothetical protein [Candidatus Moranbacteria bacterium]
MILVHGVEKAPEGYTWLGMSWEENIYAPTGMVEVLDKEKALIEIINQARNSSLEEFREYIRAANPWQGDRRKIITELRKKRGN